MSTRVVVFFMLLIIGLVTTVCFAIETNNDYVKTCKDRENDKDCVIYRAFLITDRQSSGFAKVFLKNEINNNFVKYNESDVKLILHELYTRLDNVTNDKEKSMFNCKEVSKIYYELLTEYKSLDIDVNRMNSWSSEVCNKGQRASDILVLDHN